MSNFKVITSVSDLPVEWDSFVPADIFLKRQYLLALEEARPENISLYFIITYKNNIIAGVGIVQHVRLYLQDIFRKNTGNALTRLFRRGVSSVVKGNILVIGNLTHTGQHGVYFNPELTTNKDFIEDLNKGLEQISKKIKIEQNKKIRLFLYKDYFVTKQLIEDKKHSEKENLYTVKVQPNMVLNLKPKWKSVDDYYIDLNKKYKRRYRTARKKMGDIIEVELSEAEIEVRSTELIELYRNVSDNAKLNMFLLPENHFTILKRRLGDKFRIFGFFLDNKLIGFYSLILNNATLETYFLGYNPQLLYEKQLYLNMLYNMLQFGIDNRFKDIVYARTAMEIKSSVGAKPLNMLMYIKHTTPIINRYLRPIFNLLDPTEEWQERHPFD